MHKYIEGYYCRNETELQVLNKESNRDILQVLRAVYPSPLDAKLLAEKTHWSINSVYRQWEELNRNFYISELHNKNQPQPRGRPSAQQSGLKTNLQLAVIEETNKIFDPLVGKQQGKIPLLPGTVEFSDPFKVLWNNNRIKGDIYETILPLLSFLKKYIRTIMESQDSATKEISPTKNLKDCCSQCGVNHEARDFIRAVCLCLIDEMEQTKDYLDLFKENNFVTTEAFEHALKKVSDISRHNKVSSVSPESKPIIPADNHPNQFLIQDIAGMRATMANRLQKAGFSTIEDLAAARDRDLAKRFDCGQGIAESIISTAQRILNQLKISKSTKGTQKTLLGLVEFTDIEDMDSYTVERMTKAGISSVRDLALANVDDLSNQTSLSKKYIESLILAAQRLNESKTSDSTNPTPELSKEVTVTKPRPKIRDIKGIGPLTAVTLGLAGFTVEKLAITSVEELTKRVASVSKDSAASIISGSQKLLRESEKDLGGKKRVYCGKCEENFDNVLDLDEHIKVKHRT